MSPGWQFWIDRGGTFTDVIGVSPSGQLHVRKVLSQPGGSADPGIRGARDMMMGLLRPAPTVPSYPRRIAVSISHSTRCLEVARRLTETGRTRLDPG
jgi:5-oxoprolinase (ATP-hydrolysing)